MSFTELQHCLACGEKNLEQYLNLGRQVPANTYPKSYSATSDMFRAPLEVNFCKTCFHSQLSVVVDPEILFSDYLYVSGTSNSLKVHFKNLVDWVLKTTPNLARRLDNLSVLDIGANDYSLLREFQKRGVKVEGVDPSANLSPLAGDIPALVDFWSTKTWYKTLNAPYDVITGLNVFAHNLNPLDFLRACKRVLKDDGRLILEMPQMKDTLQLTAFTQIYHEHISYFSVTSMVALVERAGMRITDLIELPEIHEGTMRFVIESGSDAHSPKVKEAIQREFLIGMHELETYKDFASRVKDNIAQLEKLLQVGYTAVAYGAAAKLSTLLGASQLAKSLAYIVDENHLKHQRYQVDSDLLIYPTSELLKEEMYPLIILIAPSNFYKEIKQKLIDTGVKCSLVSYVPTVSVEELN